ncbi:MULTISPECIES: M36 family metallopeptidase [unclassified Nocardioides]|uniref:M36 family metallopeptidase n=1 Tax=unclassified Nocardioides TaxID=2615069 RepID=UPI00361C81D5
MIVRRHRVTAPLGVLAVLTATLVAGLAQPPATSAPAPATPGPTPAPSRTIGDPVHGLRDVDVRATVAPTAAQRAAVAALGPVRLRWNDSGTPASILPRDGSLGAAVGSPVAAARAWVNGNAAVLGLGAGQVAALELVNDQRLAGSDAHAVLLRQTFGGLAPATGGLVTVGIADSQVAYVSSSLSRATGTPVAGTVSPLQGWLAAAANVGLGVPAGQVADIVSAVSENWTRLTVPGFPQQQTVRLRALPMADGSVRPVLEANVVQVLGGAATAYRLLVDGVSKDVLVRRNAVDNAMYSNVFQGTVSNEACGPAHAFELDDDLTRTINAAALALPTDDVTVTLEGPGGLHETHDLLTSPELATFMDDDGFPAGTYTIEVCPFEATSIVVGQYAVLVSTSDQGAPSAGDLGVDPRWRYFTANPDLASTDVGTVPDNSVVGCWTDTTDDCTTSHGPLAATAANDGPWDALHGLPTMTTIGNNANTHEAWANPLAPGGLFQAPLSPTREYTTGFTDAWNETRCNPSQLMPGGNDVDASVTNLFVAHNRMHDHSYYLGFTEDNYNLQLDNRGNGGVPGDQEIGNAQAGALTGGSPSYLGRDNANQITLNDGVPGITNQYLFQPIAGSFYAPCTDGALDMSIVGHEYTHAITNRMVGGPDDGLTSEQGGAMGESWGDLNAAELLFANGYSNGTSPWVVGPYATGNDTAGIRDYAIDQNPLSYSDYGFDTTGPEVHADGEIWNGTQWEVRQALVEKWDAQFPYDDADLQRDCAVAHGAQSPLAVDHCPGNRRWLQLMFDSFLLQQGSTSMLDARDAMIAADQMRFGGENADALWAAYARRGMGRDASTPDSDSHEPTPSFATPTGPNATVTFTSSGTGNVYVGDYEARVTPVADTDPATDLGASADFTTGTYRMLYVSPDRGFTRFTLTVDGGGARTVAVDDSALNLASSAAGAAVIGATDGSLNAEALIDGTEGTNWGGVTADNVDVTKPYVAVDLAGDVHTIDRVQVSALLRPAPAEASPIPLAEDPDSGSRFTALRKFELQACVADCGSPDATWTRFYTSADDAFPGARPRPVAPDQTMRSFDVPPTQAAAIRLVALENQCTGTVAYAGEQDDDPLNDTDCVTASDRGTIVHAAELQVFAAGAAGGASGAGGASSAGGPVSAAAPPAAKAESKQTTTRLVVRQQRVARGRAVTAYARVRHAGEPVGQAGRLVVLRDGHRRGVVPVSAGQRVRGRGDGWVAVRLPSRMQPGRHRIQVRFVPDGSAYLPSKSEVVTIRVVRREA